MGLAHTRSPEGHQVLAVLDEVTHAERHAERLDLLAGDGGLIAEVETVQALDEREASELGAHGAWRLLRLGMRCFRCTRRAERSTT